MIEEGKRPGVVAAFDFDNTLTDRDSFLPFLFYARGLGSTFWRLGSLTPHFLAYLVHLYPREKVKEALLTRFFKGMSYEQMQNLGEAYAQHELDRFVKSEGLAKLRWHQSEGHYTLLVSAAPSFYLQAWGKRHGFQATLATQIEMDANKQATGRLDGLNCWGPEKVTRLKQLLGDKDYTLYAYGDSRGDQELLALADYPFYRSF